MIKTPALYFMRVAQPSEASNSFEGSPINQPGSQVLMSLMLQNCWDFWVLQSGQNFIESYEFLQRFLPLLGVGWTFPDKNEGRLTLGGNPGKALTESCWKSHSNWRKWDTPVETSKDLRLIQRKYFGIFRWAWMSQELSKRLVSGL